MGIVLAFAKLLKAIAIKFIIVGGILYVEYRVAGGPPIRKVIKGIKDRKIKEQVKQAAKEGKIIYLDPEKVV